MQQTDVFDLAGAVARLGGDEELFREVVQFFMEDSPGLLDQIRVGLQENNAELVERSAHSLKSLAANFGAAQAVDMALAIERLSNGKDLATASKRVGHLEREIERLQQALASFLRGET